MKKTLEIIGLGVLICFSFILTEKTSVIIKDNDIIMTTVKENVDIFNQDSIDAKIIDDEIIPGVSGKEIDIENSYQTMKKIGIYKDNLLIYKKLTPNISLTNNYDKYVVSGNTSKKQVSIIFYDNKEIDSITELFNKYKISANFFIDLNWANSNLDKINDLSNKGYVFGNLNYNNIVNSIIRINTKQRKFYCYCEKKDSNILNECSKNKEYTILPSIVIEHSLLSNIMKEIKSGSIITIHINKGTLKELANTIEYIKSKGYEIVNLDTLLEE